MALERLRDAYFLGSLIKNFKGLFNKTNELVDAVNSLETSTTPNYKIYRALLTQSGTNAPVATVLENTLGDIVWSRAVLGVYEGTLTGAFTSGKTISPQFPTLAFENSGIYLPISLNGNPQTGWLTMFCQSTDVFTINTLDMLGNAEWSSVLGSTLLVEIIVYN